jgi:CheY-like chemotaxis protein
VLLNLIINARDAMPNGGTLTIEAKRLAVGADEAAEHGGLSPGAYVAVSIMDTGVGMSPEAARKAVEPFYSTKPMGKGSGLGLSTALGFAQQSGGGLTITSTPGHGTTVTLFLPQAEPASIDERASHETRDVSHAPGTVLVVEDEARVRKLAGRSLTSLGYKVLEAENAAVAVQLLEGEPEVDLLFTDLVMPGDMDGRALARWVLEHRPEVKVLLTTGFQDEVRASRADDQPLPLLAKPYTKDQLQQAIGDVLRERWPSVTEPHPG